MDCGSHGGVSFATRRGRIPLVNLTPPADQPNIPAQPQVPIGQDVAECDAQRDFFNDQYDAGEVSEAEYERLLDDLQNYCYALAD